MRDIHCYKLCSYNIIVDVASGVLHSVDDVTYDVIGIYGKQRLFEKQTGAVSADYILSALRERHPGVTIEEIQGIITDIDKLICEGKLFSEDTFAGLASMSETKARPCIKALCLNVSHVCNMKCVYCFAGNQLESVGCCDSNDSVDRADSVDRVERVVKVDRADSTAGTDRDDSPESGVQAGNRQPGLMSFDTGKQAIDFLNAFSGEHQILDVDFFGGEPLLNWQVVKEIVAYARMSEKFTGKKFRFTLTTNGLLIDDDVIAFTNKHFYNVVLSLDGRPETHDAMRILNGSGVNSAGDGSAGAGTRGGSAGTAAGSASAAAGSADTAARDGSADTAVGSADTDTAAGSYAAVLPKIKKLIDARRGKGYYIRATYTRANKDFVKDILHIADLGLSEISFEPAVLRRGDPLAFTDSDLPELKNQYDTLAVEMKRRRGNARYIKPQDMPVNQRPFNFYHFTLDLTGGPCIYKRVRGCGVGTEYLAVTPNGDLYPCHQFVGCDDFKMGDVRQGVTNKPLRDKFSGINIYSREECRSCWARFFCSGGCAANAYFGTGDINGIYKFGCELFRKRIENAIMLQFE